MFQEGKRTLSHDLRFHSRPTCMLKDVISIYPDVAPMNHLVEENSEITACPKDAMLKVPLVSLQQANANFEKLRNRSMPRVMQW